MQPIAISRSPSGVTPPETRVDPVCKMLVTPETAAAKYEYNGKTYYFCMPGCRDKFAADPERYLSVPAADALASIANSELRAPHSAVEFTCPMHPEIVQLGPGSCPICGMALEPKEITLDDAPDPEYLDMKRRFWVSAVLTAPVFVLAMGEMFPLFHSVVSPNVSIWVQFLLATPVVLWGGWPFFQR